MFVLLPFVAIGIGTAMLPPSVVGRSFSLGDIASSTFGASGFVLFGEYETGNASKTLHIKTPEPLKAVYMSQCVVGTPDFRAKLVKLIEETELNAVVIDIKDYSGKISFPTNNPALRDSVSEQCGAADMRAFLAMLYEKGIYRIGRITVFQDPYYTKRYPELAITKASATSTTWKDNKGLSFVDVSAKPFWEYIVALSKESYALGFDELNYDYIRFPSDGPMNDIYYPWTKNMEKQEALEHFFVYLKNEMKPIGAVLSADVFGMTTINTDDLNIGQVLERALPYFDYIAPMVYPSHYPPNFNGWKNPNTEPHDLITYVMEAAVVRAESTSTPIRTLNASAIKKTVIVPPLNGIGTTTKEVATGLYTKEMFSRLKLRPWLQDFDYGGEYDASAVRAQIQGTYDAGLTSWMLWSPSNIYTREALLSE